MTMHVKDAAAWKELQELHVKDAGTWKQVQEGWVKDAGTWKQYFANLAVSASGTSITKFIFSLGSTVYAVLEINSNGLEYSNATATSTVANSSRGNWLDGGLNSEVWVQRVIGSGSLNYSDPGSGRLQLNTTRRFGVQRSAQGTTTAGVTFNYYDAASGGNLLDSVTLFLSAQIDAF